MDTNPFGSNAPSWLREDDAIVEVARPKNSRKRGDGAGGSIRSSSTSSSTRNRRSDDIDPDDAEDCLCCCPRDTVLVVFNVWHFIAGIAGLCAFAANLYAISLQNTPGVAGYRDTILRCYALVLCAIICIAEIDWRFIMRRLRILDLWILRGLFYAFVGVLTLDGEGWDPSVQNMAGAALCIVAIIYVMMGILCLRSLKLHRQSMRREGSAGYLQVSEYD